MKFKKLVPEAVIPTKAHPTDAGFDLVATSVSEDLKRNIITYGTGIAVEIPEGHVGRYTVGDKIGQLIIQPYPEIEFEEVDELDKSDRGDGGFGSSGR